MSSHLFIAPGFAEIFLCTLSGLHIKSSLETTLYITEYLKYLPTLRVYTLWKSKRHISLMYRHPFWPRVPMWHHSPLPVFIGPCVALHLSFPVHHWLRTTQGRGLTNSSLIWIPYGNLRLGIAFLNYKIQQAVP